MKRTNFFVILFVLCGALNSYAQNVSPNPDAVQGALSAKIAELEKERVSLVTKIDELEKEKTVVETKIDESKDAKGKTSFEKDLADLKGKITELTQEKLEKEIKIEELKDRYITTDLIWKIQDSLKLLSNRVAVFQTFDSIRSFSIALIALLLLVLFVLIVRKRVRLPVLIEQEPKPTEEEPAKEQQASDEVDEVKAELSALKKNLDTIQHSLNTLTAKVKSQAESSVGFKSDLASVKQTITRSNAELSSLKAAMDKDRDRLAQKEAVEQDPVGAFNQWAQYPHKPFPLCFTFVANVIPEFRAKQDFTDTKSETDWIRNTVGEKKYLFPNPNKIDILGGSIDKLYKAEGARKAKGSNAVHVTSACQITESKTIEYQGELTLL
ncbi:hypothetical protein ACYULU_04195 [Breznakiellaceae bacterium SP9]